jgi:hypothetical protein
MGHRAEMNLSIIAIINTEVNIEGLTVKQFFLADFINTFLNFCYRLWRGQ